MATMGTTIDTLQVNITANAQSATASLKSLASALQKVRTALTGVNKDGLTVGDRLAKSLNDMNGALNTITTSSIKKLQKLANAIDGYTDAVKKLKASRGGIGASIREAQKALDTKTGASRSTGGKDSSPDKSIDPNNSDSYTIDDVVDAKWTKVKQKASMIKGFLKTIGRIAMYRAIRSAMRAVAQAFDEGLRNAYYFSKQTGDLSKLAETLDRIKSVTSQMVNQLGSFWGELIQFAAPALEWIANKVREIVEYLTEFFAAMNGDTQWKRAVYVEKSWDDATDKLKEYKHQLLGLDELNNLSKNKDNDKVKQIQDALNDFEYVDVSDKMKGLANDIRPILGWIKTALETIYKTLTSPIGLLVGGAILAFFTTHKLLGIGMMAMGAIKLYQKAKEDPDGLYNQIKGFMEKYRWLFVAGAIGLTVVGAALLFTGNYALGLGCILGGVALGASAIAMTWEKLYADLEWMFTQYAPLMALGGIGSMVVGLLLLFTGHIATGLAMLVFGGFVTYKTIEVNWDVLLNNLKTAWERIKDWWYNNVKKPIKQAVGWIEDQLKIDINGDGTIGYVADKVTTKATGISRSNRALHQMDGVTLTEDDIYTVNKDKPFKTVQSQLGDEAREGTINYLKTSALGHIIDRIGEYFGENSGWFDPYRQGEDGGKNFVQEQIKDFNNGLEYMMEQGEQSGLIGWGKNVIRHMIGSSTLKAAGGIPSAGSMFIAGESGAEFVGNIGSTSAVANTGQMTDAIYKAAYMGMSKALKENSNGNMSGWEASTTDEIFAVMRKKASNYNKRTGNPAFA